MGASESKNRWESRHIAARVLRWAVTLVPFGVSIAVTSLVRDLLGQGTGWNAVLTIFVPLVVVAISTALITERLLNRFLPLASLLELSLVFPDQVPSRFGVALRAGSTRKLARTVHDVQQSNFSSDHREAAQQVLDLVEVLRNHESLSLIHI